MLGPEIVACQPWFAVKVRTRGEARVSDSLRNRDHEVFLPTCVESRPCSDRIKKVSVALFPGYVFCRLDAKLRQTVLTTPGVDHIVGSGGWPTPIPESEIAAVRSIINSRVAAVPWPYLTVGRRIRVEYGALTGLEGLVVRAGDSERLVVSVHLLQRSVSVEIDRSWIQPIPDFSARKIA